MRTQEYSLADAMAVTKILPLAAQARQGSVRSITRLCKHLNKSPHEMPAVSTEIESVFSTLDHDDFGIAPHSFKMMCSDIRRAVRTVNHCRADFINTARDISSGNATLKHVLDLIDHQNWSKTEKRNTNTAIMRFCRALQVMPEALPANLHRLDFLIDQNVTHLTLGVGKGTYKAMRSRVRRAVRLIDHGTPLLSTYLDGAWAELWKELEKTFKRTQGWRLAEIHPLVNAAFIKGLPPKDVDDDFIANWLDERHEAVVKNPATAVQKAVRAWNYHAMAGQLKTFPRHQLTPPTSKPKSILLSYQEFPTWLQNAWDRYETDRKEDGDILDDIVDADEFGDIISEEGNTSRKLQKGTLRNHLNALKHHVTAIVKAGKAIDNFKSFRDLITSETLKLTLTSIRTDQERTCVHNSRPYNPRNAYRHSIGQSLISMARWSGTADGELKKMAKMVDRVDPRKAGNGTWMGERHAERLKQFNDPQAILNWLSLPDILIKRAESERSNFGVTACGIVDMQIAITSLILRSLPVRRENIGELRIYGDRPHIRMPLRKGDTAHMYHVPAEVKNKESLEAELSLECVSAIQLYLEHYRPHLVKTVNANPQNPHLFPARGMGHKGLSKLNNQFVARHQNLAGIHMNLHLARHLVAKIILDEDIALMETVSLLLGHKRAETTKRFYAECQKLAAQRRWNEMLSERERQLHDMGPRIKTSGGLA